jgi:peptidoglycan/LPS O-acetylase OafA/YrhL
MATKSTRAPLRIDIQVLRAFAVLGVVGFHLWPNFFVGGFVGVDVFFVISGYLITMHLIGEVFRTGSISLGTFWARRARRLLPAALLVIFVTSILVFVFQPSAMWSQFVRQAVASIFYFENWALVLEATNYLSADKPPTAVQQFWSLSVEEQFYIAWPLLILLAIVVGKALLRLQSFTAGLFSKNLESTETLDLRIGLFVVLGAVVLASFAYSVIAVQQGEPVAYFSTFSRAWEFGAGGLLAILVSRRSFRGGRRSKCLSALPTIGNTSRVLLASTGWIGLIISLWALNETTPFPGFAALLPVISTIFVIAANGFVSPTHRLPNLVSRPARQLLTPAAWIGGISYSIYLWHWPLIVFWPFASGRDPSFLDKILILAATVALGWATKKWIEDPVRDWKFLTAAANWRTGVLALGAGAVVLIPSLWIGMSQSVEEQRRTIVEKSLASNSCFGAAFIDDAALCSSVSFPLLQPNPAVAEEDKAALYDKGCISETSELVECTFGDPNAPFRIALVGDSHAASWFPALEPMISHGRVSVTTFTRFSCVFTEAPRSEGFRSCTEWGPKLADRLARGQAYDLILVVGYSTNIRDEVDNGFLSPAQATKGFQSAWQPLLERGTRIVVIRDNPEWSETPSLCLSGTSDAKSCDAPRSQFKNQTDYQFLAARQTPGVDALDMTSYLCSSSTCFSTVGGVTVYLDRSHLTATYARTLAAPLVRELISLDIPLPTTKR